MCVSNVFKLLLPVTCACGIHTTKRMWPDITGYVFMNGSSTHIEDTLVSCPATCDQITRDEW